MGKNRSTQKTPPNTGKPERNLLSSRDIDARSNKAGIIQPKPCIWQVYDATDGLPGGVNKFLQDQQGNLWLATVGGWPILGTGLVCYNGAEFITYTTADGLADNLVSALCKDRYGRLWLGTRRGLCMFDGEQFVSIVEFGAHAAAEILARCWISAICEDRHGRLWFGTGSEWIPNGRGVICLDGESFNAYTTAHGLAGDDILSIYEDRHGHLWFGTQDGVSIFDGGSFTTYTADDGLMGNFAMTICEDHQGRLWVGCGGGWFSGGSSVFDGHRFVPLTVDEPGWDRRSVRAIYEDRQGRLWITVWGVGVLMLEGEELTTFTTEDGLQDNLVSDILQDQEMGIWFAHLFNGATRLDMETLKLLTKEQVNDALIQGRDGWLWFANEDKLLTLADREQTCQAIGNPEGYYLAALLEDCCGSLWVGWGTDAGVSRYDSIDAVRNGNGRQFTTVDGLGSNNVLSLLETRDHTIWVGTRDPGTLCRFDGERFEAISAPFPMVARLLEDSRRRIWLGGWSSGGQIACYDGSALVTYTVIESSLDDGIGSIIEDDSGNLWIGTTHGLYRFDEDRFVRYDKDGELTGTLYQWSAKDTAGQLWFGTLRSGLYRYDGKHFQQLTMEDGLPSNSVTGLIPQPDGSMVISTYRGIVHYRPTATLPPGIEIQEVVADKVYGNTTELELTTAGTNLLVISYRGLSFSTRRMRYSYILEGHDKEWHETWECQARYENIPAGEYTFKVIAINRDLVTSKTPAILKLKVVPDPRDAMVAELRSDIEVKNQQLIFLKREMEQKYRFEEIIGESEAVRFVRAQMSQVIDRDVNVLITGETGTGKELVARGIHYNSSRKDRILFPCNCGSIPRELVESELFGYRKGAFTGANEDKMGLFEIASGGTVVLDEIGDMPVDIQPSLLRVLQERKFQRVGEYEFRDLDVRIISITNRDILQEIKAGRFRRDLYYRLNGFHIFVPPLRERLDDIPLLAEHFYQQACERQEKVLDGFAPEVLDMLTNHTWPGNVRELQTEIERACILAQRGSRIQTYHFSPEITHGESLVQEIISERLSYSESVKQFRRQFVQRVLQECEGNRTRAARLLGMGRSNLIHLIKDLNLDE